MVSDNYVTFCYFFKLFILKLVSHCNHLNIRVLFHFAILANVYPYYVIIMKNLNVNNNNVKLLYFAKVLHFISLCELLHFSLTAIPLGFYTFYFMHHLSLILLLRRNNYSLVKWWATYIATNFKTILASFKKYPVKKTI